MTERKILQCRSTFATSDNGNTVMVNAGDLYYSDDQLVKGRENLFAEPTVKSSRPVANRAQETATAAPGERRAVARPVPPKAPVAQPKVEDKPVAAKPKEGKPDA